MLVFTALKKNIVEEVWVITGTNSWVGICGPAWAGSGAMVGEEVRWSQVWISSDSVLKEKEEHLSALAILSNCRTSRPSVQYSSSLKNWEKTVSELKQKVQGLWSHTHDSAAHHRVILDRILNLCTMWIIIFIWQDWYQIYSKIFNVLIAWHLLSAQGMSAPSPFSPYTFMDLLPCFPSYSLLSPSISE